MKNKVIIIRDFLDGQIRLMSKPQYFCATDITTIYNEIRVAEGKAPKRMQDYFELDSTKKFIVALSDDWITFRLPKK